jgi:putative ABC transport system permease protein
MIIIELFASARRSIAAHPLFSAVVVLTLALAIGANAAVFSIVDAALLRSFNVRAPEQLVNIYTADSTGRSLGNTSYPDYAFLRDHAAEAGVTGVIGYSGLMATITGGTPEVVFGELVTENYFDVTGARIALGRGFVPSEGRTPGAAPVVVISDRLWRRRFNADPAVVGKTITLNGTSFVVVGVAAPEFSGLLFRGLTSELWAPAMMMGQLRQNQLDNRDERWMFVKARLLPGTSIERVSDWLMTNAHSLAREFPASNGGRTFAARRMQDVMIAPEGDRVLFPATLVLLGAVALIVIIAATNVANIMLARAHARQREIAVRLALGASRRRLVAQLLAESALLATLGGALGLGLAFLFARLLVGLRPPLPVPIALHLSIDARVLGFTIALTALATIVCGLFPALQSSRPNLTAALTGASTWSRGSRIARFRGLLLVPQMSLSMVLLTVAGLFTRSVVNAGAVDAGFDVPHTATVSLDLKLDGYDTTQARAFYAELTRRLMATGQIRAASVADRIPLDLYGNRSMALDATNGADRVIQFAGVDTGYFNALGIPLIAGRKFTDGEVREHRPVTIVSDAMTRRYWPATNAIGQLVHAGDGTVLTVVGVARDAKVATLGESPQPFLYRPIDADYTTLLRLIVRSSGATANVAELLRDEVHAIDPAVAIFEAGTMTSHLDVMLYPYRVAAIVSGLLGLFGLLLSSIGVFGVVAFAVTRRPREIGIRLALGATPSSILRLLFGEQGRVGGIAVAIGLALALGTARLLASVVFGVVWSDPATFLGVIAVLSGIAAVATYLPAARAMRISPASALRED